MNGCGDIAGDGDAPRLSGSDGHSHRFDGDREVPGVTCVPPSTEMRGGGDNEPSSTCVDFDGDRRCNPAGVADLGV